MRSLHHFLLVTVLAPALGLSDELINYCHDPAAATDWVRLMLRYEGDPDFRYLYTLRQALCARVDAGELSLNAAIERFEDARASFRTKGSASKSL